MFGRKPKEPLSEEERRFQSQIEKIPAKKLDKMIYEMPEPDQSIDLDSDDEELPDGVEVYLDKKGKPAFRHRRGRKKGSGKQESEQQETEQQKTAAQEAEPKKRGRKKKEQKEEAPKEAEEQEPEKEEPDFPTLDDNYVSGRRRKVDYGGTPFVKKEEVQFQTLVMAKESEAIINGIVVGAAMKRTVDGMMDVFFEVEITDEFCKGAIVTIIGEKMSKILIWNGKKKSKDYVIHLRRRWARQMLRAEIQFCLEVVDTYQDKIGNTEYLIIGNRLMANKRLSDAYFDLNDPERLREGDIINCKVLAAFNNRIALTAAGHDLYLYSTIPYITGTARITPGTLAKYIFEPNQYIEALLVTVGRENEEDDAVTNLRISFYEPIKNDILRIVDKMEIGGFYSGTVIRYLPPKEDGTTSFLIVKADVGVEVLCYLPEWKQLPMPMDSVKLKIVGMRFFENKTLVIGALKR
ncbi:MAG: hypothetical protein IJM95_04840 [Anaerotignum sp.]|nr:hypothetical protein [Anaerotignum sp.]